MFSVSQPTISRAINWISVQLHAMLEYLGTSAWKAARTPGRLLIDGTLLATWDWKGHQENYSGKHHRSGFSVQVVADTTGRARHFTTPVPGSIHDAKAFTHSDIPGAISRKRLIGDKGYIGHLDHTPIRKQPGHKELPESAKIANASINSLRAAVERVVAHVKNWRVFQTGYRGPIKKFRLMAELVYRLHMLTQEL